MTAKVVNVLTAIVALLVFAIGAGAFTLSYDALYETGAANGIASGKAWLWPLLIDAPLIVFTLALLVFQLMRQSARLWAGLVILYTALTIGFNLSHAVYTWLGWTVAIVAPVGLLLTTEALRHLARLVIERKATLESLSELAGAVSTRQAELSTLSGKIDRAKAELTKVQAEIEAGKVGEISANIQEMNAARQAKIEERREEVLRMVREDFSHKAIAEVLGVSTRTVRNDIAALNGKVGGDR